MEAKVLFLREETLRIYHPAFRSGGMYKSMYTPYKDSFKDFIIALWETPDKFYFPYEGMIDRHVRMFIDLCPIKETIYIGRVENLQQDFDINL